MESGHITLDEPISLSVYIEGEAMPLDGVYAIDPLFERQNIPPSEGSRAKKFLGETDYSLPLANGTWLVSRRNSMFSGQGVISASPMGVEIPRDWADYASFIDAEGKPIHPRVTVGAQPIEEPEPIV